MEKEELLEYARKNYPIGTQYVPAHVDIGINEVTSTEYRYSKDLDEYIHVCGKHIEYEYNYCIYANGKWATLVKPNYYELGKIKFKDKKPECRIPKFYTDEDGIPEDKIKHGSTILNENYEYAEIVDFYNEYYLVKYLDKLGKYVTLAFKEDVLEPYIEQPKEKWIPNVGDWVVSLEDRGDYRKKGDVFQVVAVDGNSIYYKEDVNGTTSTFRPAEPHEIPKTITTVNKSAIQYKEEEIKIQVKKSKTIKI